MSQTLDTNVLVYATHRASPFHNRAQRLLEYLVAGPALVYVLWPVALGYVRIVTHPAVLDSPLSSEEAVANLDRLLAPAHVRMAGEGEDFWTIFKGVAAEMKPRGNRVPDTHVVALMREHGLSTIWTHDRDFRAFSGITAKDPFEDRFENGFA